LKLTVQSPLDDCPYDMAEWGKLTSLSSLGGETFEKMLSGSIIETLSS